MHLRITIAAIVAATTIGGFSKIAAAADFYADKTIEITVGADANGGYDTYARTIARHLKRFIPGHPSIVVKNLPSPGSGEAAAYLYAKAPKDGTAIGALMFAAIMWPLLGDRAQYAYDATKFQYLGTADIGTRICATFASSKIKTFADAQREHSVMGATSGSGPTQDYVNMHKKTSGAKLDLVAKYKSAGDITRAMERGEVDGMCGWDWYNITSQRSDWLRDKKINILVQVGIDPEPELTKLGVPQIWQFISDEQDRKAAEIVVSQQSFARPYVVPPGTPEAQVNTLRNAFDSVMKDKDFLADAAMERINIEPADGLKIGKMVDKLYASPAAVIERAKEIVKK